MAQWSVHQWLFEPCRACVQGIVKLTRRYYGVQYGTVLSLTDLGIPLVCETGMRGHVRMHARLAHGSS
jgi:hypothetical protein